MKKASPIALAQAARIVALIAASSTEDEFAGRRLDANETNMLALQLEQMRAKVYEDEFAPLKARTILPFESDIDSGAETFAYEEQGQSGRALPITNYADDPPSVETEARKVIHGIVGLGDSYFYSIQDMRRAAFAGKPLQARKAKAARRAWEQGLDDIAAVGDANANIPYGALNRPIGTSAGEIRGTSMTTAAWAAGTIDPDVMLDDLLKGVREFVVDSEETQEPTDLVLPVTQYMLAHHTHFTDVAGGTVAERFLKSNGFVKSLHAWNRLKGVDGAGADTSRGLLFRKSSDVLSVVVAQEFEVLAPQPKGYGFSVLAHGRTAGTCIYRPLGMRYLSALPNT